MKILVFARAPVPGRCKTRLIPRLGALGAAGLHQRMVWRTLQTARAAGVATELWCAPDTAQAFFARCRREFGVRLRRQASGDLGRRMALALAHALRSAQRVILVGTDCPALTTQDLRDALHALKKTDVVLQPSRDGGYVLIGARRFAPGILRGITWSSGQELAQTRTRLQRANLRCSALAPREDVDTPADYLRARRAGLL